MVESAEVLKVLRELMNRKKQENEDGQFCLVDVTNKYGTMLLHPVGPVIRRIWSSTDRPRPLQL